MFLVLYKPVTPADRSSLNWPPGSTLVGEMKCMALEAKLLMKILKLNAKLLPPDVEQKLGGRKSPGEQDFKFSFLLPISPLTQNDVGRLNLDLGCAQCGEKSVKRCSLCQSVRYCSAGTFSGTIVTPLPEFSDFTISSPPSDRMPKDQLVSTQALMSTSSRHDLHCVSLCHSPSGRAATTTAQSRRHMR